MNRRVKDAIANFPLRLWVQIGRLLPYPLRVNLGGWFMRRLAVHFTDYDDRILSHLEWVYPELGAPRRQAIRDGCLDNCGRMFAEYFSAPEFVRHACQSILEGPGIEDLRQAHLEGQSAIFATGHFGSFEAGRAALINQVRVWQRSGCKSRSTQRNALIEKGWILGGLYRPASNFSYEKHHLASFSYIGEPAFKKSRHGLRALVTYLRASGWVMFLHDQHDPNGIPLSFMGRDAMTSVTAARIAIRNKSLLFPYYGIRQPNGLDFRIIVEKPIRPDSGSEEDMTRVLTRSLEAMVNQYPEQWFWVHRRWRI